MLMSCLASCIAANISQDENSMTDSQSTPISTVFSHLAIFFSGFLIAVLAEPLRHFLFKPKLELEFKKEQDFITKTPMTSGRDSYYIRVKVTNKKRNVARGCRAYLINIEKENNGRKFEQTSFCDSIPLAWSNQKLGEQYNGINLSKGVNQFVDIIATFPHTEFLDYFEPQLKVRPLRYEPLFREIGVFRFTIQVATENADPKIIKLIFKWHGKWSDFEVNKDN